ncbi:ZrgA family zinc uptake protein [Wenzhouxiangella sp. EGI_FJ10409]|uniref:ZrgA family zinc uptake protein n=1 Tax=Wenzhouxiangella sp. EGI_FJ10409 TaxID=3243767 RepID=UPI0035D64F0C
MNTKIIYCVLAACIGVPGCALAEQARREHAAHEHGHGIGSLAQDSGQWQLMLELPGHNLVGFEHPPRNDQQRGRLDAALARLEAGEWLQPDPESDCRVVSSEIDTIGYAASHDDGHETQPENGHDQNHDHDHDHGHRETAHTRSPSGGHGAFHVSAVISCEPSRRLPWLDIDLFEGFPDNRSIRIDVLSDAGAASHRLDSENFRMRFD